MTGVLQHLHHGLARMTVVEWTLIHWYLALGIVWPSLLTVFPLVEPSTALGPLYALVLLLLYIGAGLAIAGAAATAQIGFVRAAGFLIESIGLLFLAAAAVSYLFTQIALALGTGQTEWIPRAALVYAVLASLAVRGLFLLRVYSRLGHPEKQQVLVR